jgi:hypothetical protein
LRRREGGRRRGEGEGKEEEEEDTEEEGEGMVKEEEELRDDSIFQLLENVVKSSPKSMRKRRNEEMVV